TTIIASTILSVTLVPMLQFIKTKRRNKKISDTPGFLGKPLEKIAGFYSETILRKVLKRPIIVSIGGLIIATSFLLLVSVTSFVFISAVDKEEVIMDSRRDTDMAIDETDKKNHNNVHYLLNEDNNVKETAVFAGDGIASLFAASMDNTGNKTG